MTKLIETGIHQYTISHPGGTLLSFLELMLDYPNPEQETTEFDYYSGEECQDEEIVDFAVTLMLAGENAYGKVIPFAFITKSEIYISSPDALETWGAITELLLGECILIEANHLCTRRKFGKETALWKLNTGEVHQLVGALTEDESSSSLPPFVGETAAEILSARTA